MSEQPATPSPIKQFIGLMLVVVGVLWMTASGLCSLGFLVMIFPEASDLREVLSILPMIVIIGGFSLGIGFVLYIVGRALRPKT